MIDRRTFLKTVGLTVGGLSASAGLSPVQSAEEKLMPARKKLNFLIVIADDQCFRTIHALNNKEVYTPNFDRLVARGTTFTHCFHQGSWTGAVCVASRAMMHTGRYIWTCGGDTCGHYPLLGEALQMGGYHTYAVGKWHNGDETALRSFVAGKTIGPGFLASTPENGLAYNRPRPDNPWTPWDPKYHGHWTPYDLWDIEHPVSKNLFQNGSSGTKAGPRYQAQRHSCELYADSAVAALGELAKQPNTPFFLYLAWNSPHDPRQAPKEFVDMYPADKIGVPPNFLSQHSFDQGSERDEELAPFPRTPESVQVHRREYYALISYIDQQLGRVLEALEKNGLADNTCVIVTADHGLAVGEHGLMGKQNLYDCSVRMPFMMAGPGIATGRQIDALIYQHSLFPTICDLADIPTPATVQFPSLLPLLNGERGELFDSVYCAYRNFQRSVRTNSHKLILYPETRQIELFDIAKDPWEMKNLAGDAACAATISELFGKLKQWRQRVGDTMALEPAWFGIQA